jgi:CRISPR-associated protein Csx17
MAAYLKALGVLRLVSEQDNSAASGWWKKGHFCLNSGLDEQALLSFFLLRYQPSPLLAPWGARSGFFSGSSETSARKALDLISKSIPDRLLKMRNAIDEVRALLHRHQITEKPIKDAKVDFMVCCRSELPDSVVEWIDAVFAIVDDKGAFAPLLGTGANDGSHSYTSTYLQMLIEAGLHQATPGALAEDLLKKSLFDNPTLGLVPSSFGQFNPGKSGGYNQGPNIETSNIPINPWDVILTFEGAVVWSSSVMRQCAPGHAGVPRRARSLMSSPFTVKMKAIGYSSSAKKDESLKIGRAEIWMPLWKKPARYSEIQTFVREGRAEIGRRPATNGIEFAEAATSLGTDRGVDEFVRYGFMVRKGKNYVALPVGRFAVKERREAELVRELEAVLRPVDSFFYKFPNHEPPAQLGSARRGIDEAIFKVLALGGRGPVRDLVASLGKLERLLVVRDISRKPKLEAPLGGLRPEWVLSADDGSVEVRLAAALAAVRPTGGVGPLRANLAPIDPTTPWKWASGGKQVAWAGASLPARMVDALLRRTMDADRFGAKGNPFFSPLALHEQDIAAFLSGTIDESLLEDLLFGFSLIKWHDTPAVNCVSRSLAWTSAVSGGYLVPREWALLKLLFLPGPLIWPPGKETTIKPEPSIVPLLVAGRLGRACTIAQRRLFSAGLNPIRTDFPESGQALRTAGSLLFSVRRPERIARLVLHDVESS